MRRDFLLQDAETSNYCSLKIDGPCIAVHRSLHLASLGGMPGAYADDFARSVGLEQLAALAEGKPVKVVCAMSLCRSCSDPSPFVVVTSEEGKLIWPPRKTTSSQDRKRAPWESIFVGEEDKVSCSNFVNKSEEEPLGLICLGTCPSQAIML